MHTENEQNNPKPTAKRIGKPGEQIAVNRTMHSTIQLFEDESGEYYPVVDTNGTYTLIRGEYHPIGNRIQYPKAWGRKWAALKLVEHKIKVQQDILANAQIELSKLERCLSNIQQWSDTE